MESPIKPPNPKIYIDPNASSPKLKKHSLRLNSYPIIPTIMVTHTYKMPILPITLETAIDMAIAALIHPSILLWIVFELEKLLNKKGCLTSEFDEIYSNSWVFDQRALISGYSCSEYANIKKVYPRPVKIMCLLKEKSNPKPNTVTIDNKKGWINCMLVNSSFVCSRGRINKPCIIVKWIWASKRITPIILFFILYFLYYRVIIWLTSRAIGYSFASSTVWVLI